MEIRQAGYNDISGIEEVLLNAVGWLEQRNLRNWREEDVHWTALSRTFAPEDFYLAWEEGQPVGCMALVDRDPLFWPEIAKGESLFIHKLAVTGSARGKGVAPALIGLAKRQCKTRKIPALRLDCRQDRPRLRAFYEGQGFRCVKEQRVLEGFGTAFYIWNPEGEGDQ